MSSSISAGPPNMWRYDECASVITDSVNMKEYKPIG
jgi:hypothetical protein